MFEAWYGSLKNLKSVRDHGWIWLTNLRQNRKVNRNVSLELLSIPEEGLEVHLRGSGWIRVFKFVAKNSRIDYLATKMENPTRSQIETIMHQRWSVEVDDRELKQTGGIQRCQSGSSRSPRNHICLSILAWLEKHRRRLQEKISFYTPDWNAIKGAISSEINTILATC